MDRFLVRILPIILNLYIVVIAIFAWNGVDVSMYDYWVSCPISMGVLLTVLCHVQGKYHCRWIRVLCYNLVFIPLVSYIDSIRPIFYKAEDMIIFLSADMSVAILATIILAINHFRRVRKVLKKNRYEELKPIKCNRTRKD